MSLEEGYGYVMGNLTRGWEEKTVSTKNGDKLLHTSALAYQPKKDDVAQFVDLTVWANDDGSSDGPTIAAECGKGVKVMVRGVLKSKTFTKRDGTPGSGWEMSCWQVAKVIRAPFVGKPADVQVPKPAVAYDDTEPF